MKAGKVIGIIVAILLLGLIAAGVWWKWGRKAVDSNMAALTPKITVAAMSVKDITPQTINMQCGVTISNPLPVHFTADSVNYEVWIDSVQIAEDSYPKTISIKKKDSTTISLPVQIESSVLTRLLEKFEKRNTDSADYTIRTRFTTKLPIAGKREFNFDVTKKLPAIRKISAKPQKIDVEKLGLKNSKLAVAVDIKNENAFPIDIKNGKYSVQVEKDLDMDGILEKNVHIPAKGSTTVNMDIDLKTAKIPKLGWNMLFHKNKTHFQMKFTGQLRSDVDMLDSSDLNMHAEGTLEDIKELAQTK